MLKEKIVSAFCFLLVIIYTASLSAQKVETLETLKSGVVRIKAKQRKSTKTGTGFIVKHMLPDKVYIATASHVVKGDPQPKVEFYTWRRDWFEAEIVGSEPGNKGLALLLVRMKADKLSELPTLLLDPSIPKVQEEVFAIGHPGKGEPWTVSDGKITARKGRELVTSGAIAQGNSGGPLIKGNQIVGMIVTLKTPFAYAVLAPSLQLFLDGYVLEGPPVYMLTVNSVLQGIPITVTPPDRGGNSNGKTPLMLQYPGKADVSLTAQPEYDGRRFYQWVVDNNKNPSNSITVTMDADKTIMVRYRLRSSANALSEKQIVEMINTNGFNCPAKSLSGDFKPNYRQDGEVIIDRRTGLEWQRRAKVIEERGVQKQIDDYLEGLNSNLSEGDDYWRGPTIEELFSLMMEATSTKGEYMNAKFETDGKYCWTMDTNSDNGKRWLVDFKNGGFQDENWVTTSYVRAVR